ncbi:alpha/beta fold hydrolase [Cellulomonas wangsupingiae]|uniref:Alpha/beta fold hydrolase n=1 Tax=Cellulomonas wangsupingiae TaxID=2968085 RepID=A0ABY5K659_9CELL|nr:alpha/beta fold hydrolase [Cellulomonas wangsupingiae]MCC2334260.1 alpha/beta fold hydrolase [Cellulomonas wangsupingiae]UUI65937.1 alpha/beta fold hydrolase [Cellulomonas wangsupingiae]
MRPAATRPAGRLPRPTTAPARLPPGGLPGLDPAWSRLVAVPETPLDGSLALPGAASGPAADRTWHVLDTGPLLAARGLTPVGTLLCVHGNPTWSYLWRGLATAGLGAGGTRTGAWRVVAVDQLEMGYSERTGTHRTLRRRVRDLADLTDALGLGGPVVTVGHDWGGVVSLGWAVDHPDALAGVVLLDTAVHQPADRPIPLPLRAALGVLGPSTVATPAFLETTLALAHPPLPDDVKDAYRAPYRTAGRRSGIGAFVADIPVGPGHPSASELDRIADGVRDLDVPALLLWGPRDPVFDETHLGDLCGRLPRAQVHRFEGAGHLLPEDADTAGAVMTWLADRHDDVPAAAPAPPRGADARTPAGGRAPMWHHLDELADDDSTALVEMAPATGGGVRTVTWRLLARRVRELACGLHAAGVRRGDRVSLLVPPGADLTATLYACLRIGAVVVVADAGLGARGLTRAVRGAQPAVVVGERRGLAAARALRWPGRRVSTTTLPPATAAALGVELSLPDVVDLGAGTGLPPAPAPDDLAAVLFTSGSTGPAKGVVYTHAQLAAMRDALAAQYGLGVGTGIVAGFAPFALLGPALGCCSVTPDMDVTAPRTLTARAVAAAADAAAVGVDGTTVVFLSPAAVANVVATSGELTADDERALARVRLLLSAGAPVAERLLAAVGDLVPRAVPHTPYGMTEGLLLTDVTLEEIRAAGPGGAAGGACVGRPAAGVTVRISALDADGRATGPLTAAPDVTGEVVVAAPHVKDHYDRLWLTDRDSRRGTPDGDGATRPGATRPAGAEDLVPGARWHRTGDVGRLDADGRLWIEGRLAHVLVTADGPVTPVGPERRAESVPGVRRAGVVGVGPRGTQQVVVVVETQVGARRPALAAPALTAAVRTAVGRDVAAVLVVPDLPTDVRHNSKIDRARLAAWADRVLAGGRMGRP